MSSNNILCIACDGSGLKNDQPCPICGGKGELTETEQVKLFTRPTQILSYPLSIASGSKSAFPESLPITSPSTIRLEQLESEIGSLKHLLREIVKNPADLTNIILQEKKEEFLYWTEENNGQKRFDSKKLKTSPDENCPFCKARAMTVLKDKTKLLYFCNQGHIFIIGFGLSLEPSKKA